MSARPLSHFFHSLSVRARPRPALAMAPPPPLILDDEEDPFHGIVSDRKRNPMVLVGGLCGGRAGGGGRASARASERARRVASGERDRGAPSSFLSLTHAPPLPTLQLRRGRDGGRPGCRPHCVSPGEKWREEEGRTRGAGGAGGPLSTSRARPDVSPPPRPSLPLLTQGNTKVSQAMMRARVGAQAATVALMLGSTGAYAWGGRGGGGKEEGHGGG